MADIEETGLEVKMDKDAWLAKRLEILANDNKKLEKSLADPHKLTFVGKENSNFGLE